jgi:hypothetical protein
LTITWLCSGITGNVKVSLRKQDRSGGFVITESVPYNSSRILWSIPLSVGPGVYFVKVKQGEVSGVSRAFRIVMGSSSDSVRVVHDLQIRNIRFVHNSGGWIVARIKSNINRFRGRVNFSIIFPEMIRDGRQRVSKDVDIPGGSEKDVYLWPKNANTFGLKGLLTRVVVDSSNSIEESNEDNNVMEKRLTIYDLYFAESIRRSMKLKRMYLKGGKDFRVEFDMKVKNTHSIPIRNIKVSWSIQEVGGSLVSTRGLHERNPYIINRIDGGATYVKHFNFVFGKQGRRNATYPRLKSGKRYRIVMIIDNENIFYEKNERNNRTVGYFGPLPR